VEADALDGIGRKAGVKPIPSLSVHHPRIVDGIDLFGDETIPRCGSGRVWTLRPRANGSALTL
jgi:hypothetical protein